MRRPSPAASRFDNSLGWLAASQRGVVCSARDGNLRLAVRLYNHEDDIGRVTAALRGV